MAESTVRFSHCVIWLTKPRSSCDSMSIRSLLVIIAAITGAQLAAAPRVATTVDFLDYAFFDSLGAADHYELSAWDGIAVKKGTPVEIVHALNRAVEQTLQNPKVRNALIARGAMPVKANSEEFSKFIVSEHQKWRELVKKSRTSLD